MVRPYSSTCTYISNTNQIFYTSKKFLKYRRGTKLYKSYNTFNILPLTAAITSNVKTKNTWYCPHLNIQVFLNTRTSNLNILGNFSKL